MPEAASSALKRARRRVRRALGLDFSMPLQARTTMTQLGSKYGAHALCLNGLGPDSVVYSFGLGEDISFDLELIERTGASVFGFDPTPRSLEWLRAQPLPPQFQIHDWGLADYDGVARFAAPANPADISHTLLDRPESSDRTLEVPVKRLSTTMQELEHQHLDVLKMDIEGAEYSVIDELVSGPCPFDQLLIEFHHRFREIPVSRTRQAIETLNRKGFQLAFIAEGGFELSFVKHD